MAYFAEIDSNTIVTRILVVDDAVCRNENGFFDKQLGVEWLKANVCDSIWIVTFQEGSPKKMAEVGGFYDASNDLFVPPKPFPSWVLNENFDWDPPVPRPEPNNKFIYTWNEDSLSWDESLNPAGLTDIVILGD